MKIKHILHERHLHPVTIQIDLSVLDATHLMVEHNIGSVIVVDKQFRPEGILTERDVMHLVARKKDPAHTRVQDVMSSDLVVGTIDDTIEYYMQVMTQKRIRHIPIVEEGQLKAIISIGDVLKSQLKESEVEVRYLKHYFAGVAF